MQMVSQMIPAVERKHARRCAMGMTALALAALACPAVAADDPSTPPLPQDGRRFDVSAESFNVNGLPSRVSGFLSPRPPEEVAQWYREELGAPIAHNHLGARQILGKEREGQYITVQLEPAAGGGTRGVVSVASLKDMQHKHEAELAARERWRNRLPADTQLLSHVNSVDAGQEATFIAFVNRHDESLNQEGLKRALREEGLELERAAGSGAGPGPDGRPRSGTALYFKGKGREAMATVFRTADARTAVILNITTASGSGR